MKTIGRSKEEAVRKVLMTVGLSLAALRVYILAESDLGMQVD